MAIKVHELEQSWMTIGQAAVMLGKSRQATYRLLLDGHMRAALIGRGREVRGVWVVERVSVEAYARELQSNE